MSNSLQGATRGMANNQGLYSNAPRCSIATNLYPLIKNTPFPWWDTANDDESGDGDGITLFEKHKLNWQKNVAEFSKGIVAFKKWDEFCLIMSMHVFFSNKHIFVWNPATIGRFFVGSLLNKFWFEAMLFLTVTFCMFFYHSEQLTSAVRKGEILI